MEIQTPLVENKSQCGSEEDTDFKISVDNPLKRSQNTF